MSAWLLALLVLGRSAAPESQAGLRWSAPAECSDSADVETEIEAMGPGLSAAQLQTVWDWICSGAAP